MTNTAILMLMLHFEGKQGLALGISFMIMAIGGIIAPQIISGLLTNCSSQQSILIVGGILTSGLLGSAVFYPVEPRPKSEEEDCLQETEILKPETAVSKPETIVLKLETEASKPEIVASKPETAVSKPEIVASKAEIVASKPETVVSKPETEISKLEVKASKETGCWKKNPLMEMILLINWNLVKDKHFILTVLGSSYSFNALLSFFLYLPLYAGSKGLTTSQKVF